MKLHTIRRFVISLLCVVLLFGSAVSISALAVTVNSVTATTNSTVKQGNSANCYVNIASTEGLNALDVTVHFDPTKVKITSVYNSVGCTLYDSVINTDNIQFSYILDGNGTASQKRLFYFVYQVLANAEVGDTYFDITIGEAYDASLNEVEILGSRCGFAIEPTITNKSCSVYGTGSLSTSIEQEFTLNYRFSTYQIASGTAVITYDSELFKVVEVTPGAFLAQKVVDINTDLNGEIYVSFVGTEYYSNTNLVSVTFKTIKNVTETSKITLKTTELLDKQLNAISCSGYTTNVNVVLDKTYVGDSPAMRLDGTFSYADKQIALTVLLEANSNLGAGDFVIAFDPELVSYNSCTKGFSPAFFNINDKDASNGELKFHIISLSDIVTEETVLTVLFDVNLPYSCEKTDFTLTGTDLTDSLTEGIFLNFIDDAVYLEYQVTFCDVDGTLLQSGMHRYGDTVFEPDTPAKESDMYGTYTFAGWDKPVEICTADVIYTATYTLEYTNYTVVFQNWDDTELSKQTYHYGDKITVPANPTKPADQTYTHVFAGWDNVVVDCAGNATYTATYTPVYIDYTVIFQDWDGTELSKQTYHYGDKVTAPTNPTKPADKTYTYAFVGWDSEVTKCYGDKVYTATYTPTYRDYVITFVNYDGTVISEQTHHYGDNITPPENPSRASDNTYKYTFQGWNTPITECTKSTTYTAIYTFEFIEYTITFKNYDGAVISSAVYHYGDSVVAPVPTGKPADKKYTYSFLEWDSSIVSCSGNKEYTATYTPVYIDYTVIFQDWDGTELSKQTYHYGDKVTAPANPTKPADKTYTYAFAGWDKEPTCTGNMTITATYSSMYIDYTVVFQNWDGTVLSTKIYHWSDTVIAPINPTRPWDEEYIYTFAGWDKIIVPCNGNAVYTATYSKTAIVITSIAVTTKPNKLTYLEGDAFDKTGMVITAYYNNGTSVVVTNYTISGYTSTPGAKTIVVTCGEKTATFAVSVTAKSLTSIVITTNPTKTTYIESTMLDDVGMVLTLYYNNGTAETVTTGWVSQYDFSTVGTTTVTVTYGGKKCTYDVTIVSKTLTHIVVESKPNKLTYLEGDAVLATEGLVVRGHYDNNTDEVITGNYTVTGYTSTPGVKTITVTYNGKTATFTVEVTAKSLTSIAVTTKPNKITYLDGDSFDKTGMIVTAYYNNSTTEVTTDYTVSGYSSTVGTKTITVSYKGKTATFTVTVSARTPSSITSTKHTISGNNISKITAGTTVSSLLSGLSEGSYCTVYSGDSVVNAGSSIGTGMVVKIMDGTTVKASYTVIVTGDTNGDGNTSVTDMIAIKAHVLKKSNLSGAYATAADTNGDNGISITDFIQVKAKILGKGTITAR